MLRLLTLAVFLLTFTGRLFAQVPSFCTSPGPEPAENFESACVTCDFTTFNGSTAGWAADITPSGFCGQVSNDQWLGFVAGAPTVTFTLTPSNCAFGAGVQLALLDHNSSLINCNGGCESCGDTPIEMTTTGLLPGSAYYLLIDGFNGDECDFNLSVSPAEAAQTPTLGNTGFINGPSQVCPNGTVTFTIPPVAGAGFYTWQCASPWVFINDQSGPITLDAATGNSVSINFQMAAGTSTSISVTPSNACYTGTTSTKNIQFSNIPPTVLPPVSVPQQDFPYTLPWGGQQAPAAGLYTRHLFTAQQCDSTVVQQVNVGPGIGKVRVFVDQDGNGLFNGGDQLYPYAVVHFGAYSAVTNAQGIVHLFGSSAGDTIRVQPPNQATTSLPSFVVQQATVQQYNFALSPQVYGYDLWTDLTNYTPFRPGFNTQLEFRVGNQGLYEAENVQAKLVLPSFLNLVQTSPAPSFTDGDTLYWNYPTIQSSTYYSISLIVNVPIGTVLGTPVSIPVGALPTLIDENPLNNNYTLNASVVGSYDPNDKQADPVWLTPDLLANHTPIEYTIRFQNTGTYPAEFVRVIDSLPANVEPNSFRFISSSHPCTWQVYGQTLDFFFDDIQLADSVSNEPESHGFVKFSVVPRSNVALGDQISNFCDIYFDYNDPIRTNTAQSQAVFFNPNNLPANTGANGQFSVRPNPASFRVYCNWDEPLTAFGNLYLVDAGGVPQLTIPVGPGSTGININVSQIHQGQYVAVLDVAGERKVKRVSVVRSGPIRRE